MTRVGGETESNMLFFVVFFTCILVRRLLSKGILIQMFPLHENEELKRLSFSWYKKVKVSLQPLGKCILCHYFSWSLLNTLCD